MDYRIRVGNEDKIVHSSEYLAHYGIPGMKWGVRRYQNDDGGLTEAGKKRYARLGSKILREEVRKKELTKKFDSKVARSSIKAQKKYSKAAKLRNKEFGLFTTKSKADRLEYKARKLEARADKMTSEIDDTKAKIAKADALISKYNRKMSQLDPKGVENGRLYANKRHQAYADLVKENEKALSEWKSARDSADDYFAKNGGTFYKETLKEGGSYKENRADYAVDNPKFKKMLDVESSAKANLNDSDQKLSDQRKKISNAYADAIEDDIRKRKR